MKIRLNAPLGMETLARMAGGRLAWRGETAAPAVSYVCTDSREADGETLLCAIRGERVDGHAFLPRAAEGGCRAFLCEKLPEGWEEAHAPLGCAAIVVEDTVEALGRLANARRAEELRALRITAVTGSVGKTTTKEMIAAVLAGAGSLFKKDGNYNSTIGLPLSFMEISPATKTAVLEMGMSARGEITAMTTAVCPDVAVIANVGTSHMEYLGSRENIARAKLEIARGLRAGGTLVVNGDEPLLSALGQDFSEDRPKIPADIRVLRLSLAGSEGADYTVTSMSARDDGMHFDLRTPTALWQDLVVPALGEHLVWAAAFAAIVGSLYGLEEAQIKAGLLNYRPADMRQNTRVLRGVTFITDCYNAAPESMRAALGVLSMTAAGGRCLRRIAVLGDMKELGENTVALHRGVGAACADKGVDLLITVGELGAEIARGAREAGMPAEAVCVTGGADTYGDTAADLAALLREGDCVLFKASRSMKLETIAEAVMERLEH